MRLFLLIFLSLVISPAAFAANEAQVFSIDPCDVLVRQKGNLNEVLQPRLTALDLLQRIEQGENLHIVLGKEEKTEISVQVAKTEDRAPVIVKTHENSRMARLSSDLYGQLKEFKSQGLLPGFQLFEFIERDDRSNIFKFEEGRELVSMPGDVIDLSNKDLRALQRSYEIRLNHTRAALERAGAVVEMFKPEGDLAHLSATTNKGESLVYISPYHVWVTIDGRFLIFDPL